MPDAAYRCEIALTGEAGPEGQAALPAGEVVAFGVHGAYAEQLGMSMMGRTPVSAPMDHLVAAVGACLLTTFGGALATQGIAAGDGRLSATAVGEAKVQTRVLVLQRVHVAYHVDLADELDRGVVDEVFAVHAYACPLYRSVHPQIHVTTELHLG